MYRLYGSFWKSISGYLLVKFPRMPKSTCWSHLLQRAAWWLCFGYVWITPCQSELAHHIARQHHSQKRWAAATQQKNYRIWNVGNVFSKSCQHFKTYEITIILSIIWEILENVTRLSITCITIIAIVAINWLVVWNIFYFPIYLEQSSQLTFIFFRGMAQPPTRLTWIFQLIGCFRKKISGTSHDLHGKMDGFRLRLWENLAGFRWIDFPWKMSQPIVSGHTAFGNSSCSTYKSMRLMCESDGASAHLENLRFFLGFFWD